MAAKNYKETKVYKLAFEQAMDVFEISKTFPKNIFIDRPGKAIIPQCLR